MMNALALGLVLTSLLTAGFFSPTPKQQDHGDDDVIVKEGRRVVVVEYEKDEGNTKVSISPQHNLLHDDHHQFSEKIQDVNEGIKEIAEKSKDKLSEKIEDVKEEVGTRLKVKPRELVCDAYGKCKHKMATIIGKTTDAAEEAKGAVTEAAGKVKATVTDSSQTARESVEDSATRVKEKVSEKVGEVKEEASKRMEGVKKMKREGEKELTEIMHHASDVVGEVFSYVLSAETVAPVTGVLHLMGFAAAYGMCVWVSFASSHVLAGALPMQQFAMVQSRIYPLYFKGMGFSVGMALLGHLMSPRKILSSRVGMFQGFDLMAALVLILVNLFYLEPRASKVMHERSKMEKDEGTRKEGHGTEAASAKGGDSAAETAGRGVATDRGKRGEAAAKSQKIIQLTQTLQRLNSYSSFLNVMTLVALTWHLVSLGPRLHTVC